MSIEIGARLAELGLRPALVREALGAPDAVRAARDRDRLATRADSIATSKAGALIALFVAGRSILASSCSIDTADVAILERAGLVCREDGRLRAPRALLPVADGVVCAPWTELPDDSSFHLLGALPSPRGRWLDIGTGSAFAPLLAARAPMTAADIDPDLLSCADVGRRLSPRGALINLVRSDLFEAIGEARFDLISFNAPIEGAVPLLTRFFRAAPGHIAERGVVVVHSVLDHTGELGDAINSLGGQFVTCRYTPAHTEPAFAISAWYPGLTSAHIEREVQLTSERRHARRDWISPE